MECGKPKVSVKRKCANYCEIEHHQLLYCVSLQYGRQRTKNYGMRQKIRVVLLSALGDYLCKTENALHALLPCYQYGSELFSQSIGYHR